MALNRREKALLSLPVVLGGVMSFYNWVHEPLSLRRDAAQKRTQQVQAELKKEQAKLSGEGDLEARARTVAAREKTVDGWVPGKNSAAQFIWYLSQAEQYSGAHVRGVTLSGYQQVTPQSEPTGETGKNSATRQNKPATSQQKQPADAQQESAAGTQVSAKEQGAKGDQGGTPTTLTVVKLDLKVDGKFVEHLLFNQAVEQMPLFLNTDAMSLSRAEDPPLARLGEFLLQGDLEGAEALLTVSPVVAGEYHINLYFKGEKAGPATSTMQFADEPGRVDPFAMEGVPEFVQSVVDYYANPEAHKVTNPDGSVHVNQDGSGYGGQLG